MEWPAFHMGELNTSKAWTLSTASGLETSDLVKVLLCNLTKESNFFCSNLNWRSRKRVWAGAILIIPDFNLEWVVVSSCENNRNGKCQPIFQISVWKSCWKSSCVSWNTSKYWKRLCHKAKSFLKNGWKKYSFF